MRSLAVLLCLVCASPLEAQTAELFSLDEVWMGGGTGGEFGKRASWWTLSNSISRWRLVYDQEKATFVRFDLGLNLERVPSIGENFWVGFSFDAPYSEKPPGLYPKYRPGEGGRGYFLGEYVSEHWWLEGRYPLADTSEGISWPWSVDLRELRLGHHDLTGGDLQATFKVGYHSERGSYGGAGLKFTRGRATLSLDSLDGLSVEYSTEITGR